MEPGNRILGEIIGDKVRRALEEKKHDFVDVRLCDFDDAEYRVYTPDAAVKNVVRLSMKLPSFNELKDGGVDDVLNSVYKDLVLPEADAGYQVTLEMDLAKEVDGSLQQKIAELKSNVVGAPFSKYFEDVQKNKKTDLKNYKFQLRHDTEVYFVPRDERCTVIFAVDFGQRVDRAIARVFLQEFAESRRHLGAAPPCSFNHNPPQELSEFGITEPISADHVGFISFAILPSHVRSDDVRKQCAAMMSMFRNYLMYHIKCSKSYFHQRMRMRVVTLLKVLNRAKQNEEEKEKKTMQGKTFVKK